MMVRLSPLRGSFIMLVALGLAACNGGGGSVTPDSVSPLAYVRFVQGSSAAPSSVDVLIDGQPAFTAVAPNSISSFLSISIGSHVAVIYPAGNDTGTPIVPAQTFSVVGADYETLALGGRNFPVAYALTDQIFSGTYRSFGAVNFYNIAPTDGANGLQFGFFVNPQNSTAQRTLTPLGNITAPGVETAPIAVPAGVTIGFGGAPGGTSLSTATILPSAIDPVACAANTFACSTGFASLFYLDGNTMIGQFSASGT